MGLQNIILLVVVFCTLAIIHGAIEPPLEGDGAPKSAFHREKDHNKDGASKIDIYEKFLKAYESELKSSKLYTEGDEERRRLLDEEFESLRYLLHTPVKNLKPEDDKDISLWVRQLNDMSEGELKEVLKAMFAGTYYFTTEFRQTAYMM